MGVREVVLQVLYDAGFNSSGRFYEKSTEILGMTPTQLLGDDTARLQRELANAFPSACVTEDDELMGRTVTQVVKFIEMPSEGLQVPLDVRGSEIEAAVWQALRAIPAGETRTYGGAAKSLSLSATAQEVGAACAANVLAVVVPCHRVVKADGSISGYRWGVARKRRLINREAIS